MLASKKTYQSLIKNPSFVPERAVLSADLRNHGESPQSPEVSYRAKAADVLRLMDSQNIESAVLCGHSMGGKVAMTLALAEPSRVAALVVIDIGPREYKTNSSVAIDAVRAMADVDPTKLRSRADGHAALRDRGVLDEGVRHFVLTNLVGSGPPYKWQAHSTNIAGGIPDLVGFPRDLHLSSFTQAPVLFIRGALSDYIRPTPNGSAGPEADRLFPDHELVTIPGAGHWLQSQRPEELCSVLDSFLTKHQA